MGALEEEAGRAEVTGEMPYRGSPNLARAKPPQRAAGGKSCGWAGLKVRPGLSLPGPRGS